ncbi:helix-turn-helix domain-containing protein [Streptomyces sp. NBC_00289]|uniref:helix-turn-helix domain-containing protein n=1 Tax=Streptomyces sp. NBC_00289 TaxID=2975703 RepID=UPI003251E926
MRYPDGGGLTAKQRARREQVRFEAAELLAQGVTPPQVARRLRVSCKSAYAWHARWRDGRGPCPRRPSRPSLNTSDLVT